MHRTLRLLVVPALLLGSAGLSWAQDAKLARNLAATCANCHGTNGHARGDMKPLASMSSGKMLALLADYKSGAQPSTVMGQLVKGYTDAQLQLIAGFFAAQPAGK